MNFSVALFGNCFTFNSEYNENKDEAAGKRVSSLTGPSFGLNLIVELDLFNYLKGNITKHVSITKLMTLILLPLKHGRSNIVPYLLIRLEQD